MYIHLACLFLRSSVRQTADSVRAIQTVASSERQIAAGQLANIVARCTLQAGSMMSVDMHRECCAASRSRTTTNQQQRRPTEVPIIESPPEKSHAADNLSAKIRPARQPPGRVEFLHVKCHCRPGKTFLGGDSIMGRLLCGRRYFDKEKYINSVIISLRADFSWGRHFNVIPAQSQTLTAVTIVSRVALRTLAPALAALRSISDRPDRRRSLLEPSVRPSVRVRLLSVSQ